MGDNEKNALIVEALMCRTEAKRKAILLSHHLAALGSRMRDLADSLSPQDGKEPAWEMVNDNLSIPHPNLPLADVVNIDKLQAHVAELIRLRRTVEEQTAKLQAYGAE